MAFASSTRGKIEDTRAQIAQLRKQVDALTQDRITPAVTDFASRAGSAAGTATDAVRGHTQVIAGQVQERPWTAILIAAAVGWVIGRLLP